MHAFMCVLMQHERIIRGKRYTWVQILPFDIVLSQQGVPLHVEGFDFVMQAESLFGAVLEECVFML